MKLTRLTELSLFHYVKDALARNRKKERPKSADFRTYSLKYINILHNYPVVVYVNGLERSKTDYKIDYNNSLVVFNSQLTSSDVVEVDYTYCPLNIYDEGQNPNNNDFKYPAIAIYELRGNQRGKELGTNKKEKLPTWVMEVHTERGGENNDVKDTIVEMFEEGVFPIIDFNKGFPTNADGSINEEFSMDNIYGYMECDSINYNKGGSLDIGDKPRFLSEIIIDLTINT